MRPLSPKGDDVVHRVDDPLYLDLDPAFFADLAPCRVADRFPQLDRATGHTPAPPAGLVRTSSQEDSVAAKDSSMS